MSLVSSKQLEANRAELTVEVKGEKYHAAVENAFRARAAKITLPGFRKGKAPRAMIERAYGKGLFYEDAMNNLYPEAYSAAVEEAGIEPVESAQVEILEVNDEGFSFKAVVTTKPEVTLGEYMGVKAIRPVRETTDEEIGQRLEAVRAEYARTVTVSDRPAQINDNTDIDFEGFVDGEAFEGGKGEHFSLTLGSGTFIPGFEDQIVGHAAGEEFDVRVTFPEDYAEKKLAGKEAVFKVKLNEIHERQLPDLDDEFAKDASEFDTLDEYKADLRAKMTAENEQTASTAFENNVMDAVVAGMTADIPAVMIDSRVDELVRDFAARMGRQGLKLEDFLRYSGETQEKFRESFRPQAERQVKVRLAMEAVAKAQGLAVSDEEFDAEYQKMAEAYKTDVEQLRAVFPQKEMQADLLCQKALETVVAAAVALPPEESPEEKSEEKTEAKPKRKTSGRSSAKAGGKSDEKTEEKHEESAE